MVEVVQWGGQGRRGSRERAIRGCRGGSIGRVIPPWLIDWESNTSRWSSAAGLLVLGVCGCCACCLLDSH